MKLTENDIRYIDEIHPIFLKGHYCDGERLKEVYMRVLSDEIKQGKYQSNLSIKCGGCLRKMHDALWKEKEEFMNKFQNYLDNEETVEEQD